MTWGPNGGGYDVSQRPFEFPSCISSPARLSSKGVVAVHAMSTKRTRSDSDSVSDEGDDDAVGGTPTGTGDEQQPPPSGPAATPDGAVRQYGNATLGPTLRSAGLGQTSRCFLCTFTDAALAEGSMFPGAIGPLKRVTLYWNENVDTMDVVALSEDCLKLLRDNLKQFVLTPLSIVDDTDRISTGESAGVCTGSDHPNSAPGGGSSEAEDEVTRHMTLADVTPECIRTHFTVCATTPAARLSSLKQSCRHLAQLASALAGAMYVKDAKTGRAHPDLPKAALLLKVIAAQRGTTKDISVLEGKIK
jgi:hypothetical protein